MQEARYITDGGRRYLVLEIASSGRKRKISAEEVGTYCCDHVT